MEFKDKVREVRGRLILTQKQLAKELGVTYTSVNRWENGHIEPSFLTIKKFEDFCHRRGIKLD